MIEEKIIFLHIPKTAGSSLRHIVSQYYSPEQCLLLYYPLPYDEPTLIEIHKQLPMAKIVYGHVGFGIHEFLGIKGKYVTFLRHPIDRIISFYKHNANDIHLPHYTSIQEGMSLFDLANEHPDNHMVRILANYWSPEIEDETWLLEQALENIRQHFIFIGLMENFEESVIRLSQCLGWTTLPEIPYINVGLETYIEVDMTTHMLLEKRNRIDLKLYEIVRENFLNERQL